ncbi:Uncharacterised protein [Staphylococcus aureus]|nr:Uncharacterised protein [Staphylococcus aureus]
MIVSIISARLGKFLLFNLPNQEGKRPSRPKEYNKREPANIIPMSAVNIPITEIACTIAATTPNPLCLKAQPTGSALPAYAEYVNMPTSTSETATNSTTAINSDPKIPLGIVFCGLIASAELAAIESKPIYAKKIIDTPA